LVFFSSTSLILRGETFSLHYIGVSPSGCPYPPSVSPNLCVESFLSLPHCDFALNLFFVFFVFFVVKFL
jgi:hypothetical protein